MSDEIIQTPDDQDGSDQTLDLGTDSLQQDDSQAPDATPQDDDFKDLLGEGNEPDVDYREKFSASSKEALRQREENKRLREELERERQQASMAQQYAWMNQQMSQMQQQPQQRVLPQQNQQFDAVDLSKEVEDLQDAFDKFDAKRAAEIQDRIAQKRFEASIRGVANLGVRTQAEQAVSQFVNTAPEISDPARARDILTRAWNIQTNPVSNSAIPQGSPINLYGYQINPYAVKEALLWDRAERGGNSSQGQRVARNKVPSDLGGNRPASAAPKSSSFNPMRHLTETERETVEVAIRERPGQYGKSIDEGYRNFFKKNLTEKEKKKRIKYGAPSGQKAPPVFRPYDKRRKTS